MSSHKVMYSMRSRLTPSAPLTSAPWLMSSRQRSWLPSFAAFTNAATRRPDMDITQYFINHLRMFPAKYLQVAVVSKRRKVCVKKKCAGAGRACVRMRGAVCCVLFWKIIVCRLCVIVVCVCLYTF
jgi:hypothetical protein